MDEKICNPHLLNGWKLTFNVHASIKKFKKEGPKVMLREHRVKNEWNAWELMDGRLWCCFHSVPHFLGFLRKVNFYFYFYFYFFPPLGFENLKCNFENGLLNLYNLWFCKFSEKIKNQKIKLKSSVV